MFWIQLSRRLNKYMHEICQIFQKLDYQGAEGKSFFQIFKWVCVLVLINVMLVFL